MDKSITSIRKPKNLNGKNQSVSRQWKKEKIKQIGLNALNQMEEYFSTIHRQRSLNGRFLLILSF